MSERSIDISAGSVTVTFGSAAAGNAAQPSLPAAGVLAPADRPPLDAVYRVHTQGRTAQEIADRVAALTDYHAAKSQRIFEAELLLGTAMDIDGHRFTWSTITVQERGTDCQLTVDVVDSSGKRPASAPWQFVRRTVADLPTNDEMLAAITASIREEAAAAAAESAKLIELQTLLGGV